MAHIDGDSHRRCNTRAAEVGELATRQHGVVARWQLMELGLSCAVVDWWVRGGRLRVVHHGVYAVGHGALSRHGRLMAAVLACGLQAVLSHRSAAWLWNLRPDNRSRTDVTVPGRRRQRRGLVVHQVRRLGREDRARIDGVPVTSLARTLLDLAEVVRAAELDKAIEEAERLGIFDLNAIDDVMRRSHGRRGLKPLREALDDNRGPPPVSRSELERRFMALVRRAGLPRPSQNVPLLGYEVDALWEEQKLVVELDGYAFHRTRKSFEDDRARDAKLQLAGYRVIRVTDRMLNGQTVEPTLRGLLRT